MFCSGYEVTSNSEKSIGSKYTALKKFDAREIRYWSLETWNDKENISSEMITWW